MKSEQINQKNFYDVMIRLAFLALIVAWCMMILFPFTSIILWSIILAMALAPLHKSFSEKIGGRSKIAAFILVFFLLLILLIPGWLFLDSMISGIKELKSHFDAGTLTIPPPTEKVKTWPLIGNTVYSTWYAASESLEKTLFQYKDQLIGIGGKLLKGVLSIGSGTFQIMLSLVIAGFLLVIPGAGEFARKLFRRLAGTKGDEFADMAAKTVGNVVKGVLGVAFIQSVLIGTGFILAGVPFAGLWTLVIFILAVLQIPTTLVVLPVVIWLFSTLDLMPAILWTVFLMVGGISDNVLKPILLGKGAPVPMIVIFLGVIGGFIFSGFIGLFTGAIVLSVGYKLLVTWVEETTPQEPIDSK